MELQKRDRGSVRTAKDIERKYDLTKPSKLERKIDTNTGIIGKLEKNYEKIEKDIEKLDNKKADKEELPTKVSELENDEGFLKEESDPTVPAWAKKPIKPSYTAKEVGALPDNTIIPSIEGLVSKEYVDEEIGKLKEMMLGFEERISKLEGSEV